MMTHRALVHEYVSCIVALDLRRGRRAAALDAALPLGPDARLPAALPRGRRDEPPADAARRRPTILERVAARRHRLALPRRPPCGCRCRTTRPSTRADLGVAAQGVLRRLDHAGPGAATGCSSALPGARLLQLLRPVRDRSARDGPAARGARRATRSRAAAPCSSSRHASSTAEGNDVAAGEPGEVRLPLAAAVHRLLEQAGGDRRGLPRRLVPLRRPRHARRGGLPHRRRPHQGRHQHRRRPGRLPRGRGRALHAPGRRRGRGHRRRPHERWVEAVTAVVVLRDGRR